MNPHYPLRPLNPNPNFQNPQFNPIPPQPQPQIQPQPSISELSNTLKTLIQSSTSSLHSLTTLLPPLSPSSTSLLQCPSNPHHWVPPSSLFLHTLHCPSPLDLSPLLDTLQYPNTLKTVHNLVHQNKFVHPLNDPTSELCFCIDDYVGFGSNNNFFYKDCPGVVSSKDDDVSKRVFTLPRVLSFECANFEGGSDGESDRVSIKMVPSEIWVVRREIELWSDYPSEYSCSVSRALLCVECVEEREVLECLIANSPRFGVVIDVAMRDHMYVLFRLCLKAMAREAARSYWSMIEGDNGVKLDLKCLRFKCPVMVEALRWLGSQLSILYGEINAKSFVIAMLRHLLSDAVSHASVIPLERKLEHSSTIEQGLSVVMGQPSREDVLKEGGERMSERIFGRSIFVYQIAAAIAALHERSLLEERIRALRNPLPLTSYQRMAEHQYFSMKADEERQKRPDYRPLIEHDSLHFQRQNGEETNKLKTREELLAEERDYKRRRMSYRGKKQKRTTKEVMRNIIEEYMEAIKKTGGIGGDAEGAISTSENSYGHNSTSFAHHSTNDQQYGYSELLDNDYESRDKKPLDASPSRKDRRNKESYNHRHLEDKRISRERSSRDYYNRSPSVDRKSNRSREHRSHRRNQDVEIDEDEHFKSNYSFSNISGYNDQKSLYSTSSTFRSSSGRKDKRKLGSPDRDRHRRKKNESDGRGSFRSEFSDRYDPSEASDI